MNTQTENHENLATQDFKDLSLPELSDEIEVQTDTTSLVFNTENMAQMMKFAEYMSVAKSMLPSHISGNKGDCLAVVMQAMQWGMNPFVVAQKTFVISGKLGYEAQLVNAVITNRAPIKGRLKIKHGGNWDRILGKISRKKKQGEDKDKWYNSADWTDADEEDLTVTVSGTFIDENEPRELTVSMRQCLTRNSPLWVEDPKQQIAYLAIKRWARLHCPDVILGVYTPDEFHTIDVTPPKPSDTSKTKGVNAVLSKIKSTKEAQQQNDIGAEYNISELLDTIAVANDLKSLNNIGKEIKAVLDDENINLNEGDEKHITLRNAYAYRRAVIEVDNIKREIDNITNPDELSFLQEKVAGKVKDLPDDLAKNLQEYLQSSMQ